MPNQLLPIKHRPIIHYNDASFFYEHFAFCPSKLSLRIFRKTVPLNGLVCIFCWIFSPIYFYQNDIVMWFYVSYHDVIHHQKKEKKTLWTRSFFFSLFYVFNSQSQRFFEWHEKNSFIYNVWCNINSLVSFGKSFVSRLAYVTNAKFIQINHGSESRSCDRIQAMQATQGNNSQKLVE